MFTQSFKSSIAFRFYLNKLSGCSMFHWDYTQNKLVLSSSALYFTWLATLFFWWFMFLPAFIVTIYNDFKNSGDTDITGMEEEKRILIVFYVLAMFLAGYSTLPIGSILQQHRMEAKNVINACFDLDTELSENVSRHPNYSAGFSKLLNQFEWLSMLFSPICFSTSLLFSLGIFHQAHPIHRVLHFVFGITMHLTPMNICICVAHVWWVFTMTNTVVALIYIYLQVAFLCISWSRSITPTAVISSNQMDGKTLFKTKELGLRSADKIIWVYRCIQILCNYAGVIMAKCRIAFHMVLLHVIIVAGSFIFIEHFGELIEQGEYSFLVLIVVCLVASLLIIQLECPLCDAVVERSKNVATQLIKLTGRKRYVFKTASSFIPHRVVTTYPFFNVSQDTLLDFLNISNDHLANLLLM